MATPSPISGCQASSESAYFAHICQASLMCEYLATGWFPRKVQMLCLCPDGSRHEDYAGEAL